MSNDAQITIFGTVSDPAGIELLAQAAAAEGGVDWAYHVDADRFVDFLEKAAELGQPVLFTRWDSSSGNLFHEVMNACRTAGLSYVMTYGETGVDGHSNGVSWRPGMKESFGFLMADGKPVLRLEDVRQAAEQGLGWVNALVAEITNRAQTDKIEIDPEFRNAWQAHLDAKDAPRI